MIAPGATGRFEVASFAARERAPAATSHSSVVVGARAGRVVQLAIELKAPTPRTLARLIQALENANRHGLRLSDTADSQK